MGHRQGRYPPLGVFSKSRPPQETFQKSSNFQHVSRTPQNHKKCSKDNQKASTCELNITPGTPNYWIRRKSEIIQNTLFLQRLWHIQSLHSGIISIRGARKTWTWKLSSSSQPQITENQKIVPKVCSRRVPKSDQKSLKTDIWGSVWPLGVSLDPRTTKMMSQVPEKTAQGLQNTSLKRKKWPIAAINLSAIHLQSSSLQLTN